MFDVFGIFISFPKIFLEFSFPKISLPFFTMLLRTFFILKGAIFAILGEKGA